MGKDHNNNSLTVSFQHGIKTAAGPRRRVKFSGASGRGCKQKASSLYPSGKVWKIRLTFARPVLYSHTGHTERQNGNAKKEVSSMIQIHDYYHADPRRPDIDDMIFGDEHPHSDK